MSDPNRTIAFQGELGANSHMACQAACPDLEPLPCHSFEDMLGADDFYWFTIEAAPADGIHIMSNEEIARFGLVTQ